MVFERGVYRVFDGTFDGVLTRTFDRGLDRVFKTSFDKFIKKSCFLAKFLTWFMTRFLTKVFDNFQICYELVSFKLRSKTKFENFLSLFVSGILLPKLFCRTVRKVYTGKVRKCIF